MDSLEDSRFVYIPFPLGDEVRVDRQVNAQAVQLWFNVNGQAIDAGVIHVIAIAFPHDPCFQIILSVPVVIALADDDGVEGEMGLEPAVESVADDGGHPLGGVLCNRGHNGSPERFVLAWYDLARIGSNGAPPDVPPLFLQVANHHANERC